MHDTNKVKRTCTWAPPYATVGFFKRKLVHSPEKNRKCVGMKHGGHMKSHTLWLNSATSMIAFVLSMHAYTCPYLAIFSLTIV